MKKKLLALFLVLLVIPAAAVLAAQAGWADLLMEDTYVVIGGDQTLTIRSHTEPGGRGGYSQALYAWELTGTESKAELDAIAVELLKSGTEPVWGGSKHCYHGGTYVAEPQCTLTASDFEPGSYLYVCYAFGCEGGSYNHYLTPYYERISTMSVRITREARGLELSYVLKDRDGRQLAAMEDGGTAELDLNGGMAWLQLQSAVEYPTERVVAIRADFPKNQAVDPFEFEEEGRSLKSVCCGSGSLTVTIRPYLSGEVRTETIYIDVPCAPMAEPAMLTEPTCTEDGLSAYLCHGHGINCETVFEEIVLPATGHTLESVSEYIEKPTASLPGIGMGTCKTCGMSGVEQQVPPIFCDVESDSFYSRALDYCHAEGWVNGVSADLFAPGNACVRAQVVTFLWRAAGCPMPEGSGNPFTDVTEVDFYYDAVLWAVEQGITTGTDASHFSPMGVCNRAQVVTFLWRAFGQPDCEAAEQPFADVEAGSWYERPVLWAVEEGITSGMTPTSFGPAADCNRAQIVTFLYRAYAE